MDLRPGTSLVIGVEHLESPSFGFLASHSTLMLHDPRVMSSSRRKQRFSSSKGFW